MTTQGIFLSRIQLCHLKISAPPYRHAAPSGPWPWMDFDVEFTTSTTDIDQSWRGYPQNQFGNWTPDQVGRSKMLEKCLGNESSTIYWTDVDDDRSFASPDIEGNHGTMVVGSDNEDRFWDILQKERPENVRVRSIFVDDLTSPVLRMLGTTYNIEPFFFTSSINWIPSRYQEAPVNNTGDRKHYYYPAICTNAAQRFSIITHPSNNVIPEYSDQHSGCFPSEWYVYQDPYIHIPTSVLDGSMLFIDLLAIHMIRDVKTSTIISYHPESTWCRTSAKRLNSLMQLVGGSVYWQKIFEKSKDPTFLFLAILWYPLYAWDESFELLYTHVGKMNIQESKVLQKNDMELTRELRILQAHLLHYQSLLHNFEVSVQFIAKTHNPAMDSKKRREMLTNRLKNVMDLAFATINLNDSTQTRELTEATVRDSAAMKQISYLTMIFLPASFLASVFGMNVGEFSNGGLQTLAHYAEVTVSLTLLTIYVVVTFQTRSSFHDHNSPFLRRAVWPVLTFWKMMYKLKEKPAEDTV
ncbi:hypothetical protein BDR03DRAFT_983811 [Suillus americanus]|nr:hypothetical protein BDR03DRAFT_983811 [Suillus americanus]